MKKIFKKSVPATLYIRVFNFYFLYLFHIILIIFFITHWHVNA